MNLTKLCETEDFSDPDLYAVARGLDRQGAGFADTAPDVRDWMTAMAVRALVISEALSSHASVLTVGSGVECVVSCLAERVGHVSGVEWSAGDWSRHPAGAFDACVCGPIEGVRIDEVAGVAAELGRMLRVGGVMSLSTRFRLSGPPGGLGWPGRALMLSADDIRRHVVVPSGLELVGELQERLSDQTLAAGRSLRDLGSGADDMTGPVSSAAPVAVLGGYVFTIAHVLLRKTKESDMKRSVSQPSAAPTEHGSGELRRSGGGGWSERVVGLQQRLASIDDLRVRTSHQIDRLSDADYDIGRSLAGIGQGRRAVEKGLLEAAGRLPPPEDLDGRSPPSPLRSSSGDTDMTCCSVGLAEGLRFSVMVDSRSADPITTTFLTGHCLFQHLVSLMLELVYPGDAVLDVGAHLGTFTLAAAAAGCPVLAIEASPDNARLLRASVAHNGFHRARVVSAAASDQPTAVQFCAIGPWGTVVNRPPSALSIEVPAVTIDELVSELGFPPPRFVKMDVEGSEIRAMRGMSHLLSQDDAPALLLESNGHTLNLMGTTPSALLCEVESFGYTAYLVDGARLVPVRSVDLQPRTEVDYLALKRWPESLTTFVPAPALTTEERVAMLVDDCGSESEDCRAYIGRAVADAPPEVHAHPDLRAALGRLAEDPVGTVRDAVGWWSGSRRS